MSNQVSGLAGYNFYQLNSDGTTYTKLNDTPVGDGVPFTEDGLTQDTDYSGQFGWTAVDNAGNESWPPTMFTTGAQTLNPTPDEIPMGATDTAAIDNLVAQCMAADNPAYGVTIEIVSPKGYYIQSYGTDTAAKDYYRVASQTKTFTATAVLRAVDQGLITLDDHLSDHLAGYPVDPTIQQMMNMTSGIYDYELAAGGSLFGFGLIPVTLGEAFTLNPTMAYTVNQLIALIKAGGGGTTASEFAPGTSYYYTNSNYYVLAKIIEKVDPAGRAINQIIQQDILTPLGMVNTYFQTGTGTPRKPYSPGYDYNGIDQELGSTVVQDCSDQNSAFVWAAGAIISQVGDMIKWGKELMNGTLLSTESQTLRMTAINQWPIDVISSIPYGLNQEGPDSAGYGLGIVQVGSWFGHDGSWLGTDSCTMFHPGTGSVITVYENFQTPGLLALTTIWYEIAEYLYPGSAFYTGWGEAESTTLDATLQPMTASLSGADYDTASITMPFTMPGTFT